MRVVNFGVIGLKGIGQTHIKAILDTEEAKLVAVADVNEEIGKSASSQFNVEWYSDYERMLEREDLDAVTICTPHFLHASMALKAMEYGKNVLVEKPMAISVVEADEMIEEAKKRDVKLGVVYQFRTNPVCLKIKETLEKGVIGSILRVCMEACVFRTQTYYDRDSWRGKWATEGGGALINQTIHYLDLLQWLVGKPSKLQGWISTLLHRIEVEDIASSTIIFENGAHGILQVSTIDAPPMVRFEISGSKGKIINEDNEIMLSTLEKPINEYIQEETVWGGARFEWKKVRPKVVNPSGHIAVVKNFARAIIEEREPMVPGIEGRVSLEIVNAIILSNFEGKPVKFPINREKYSRLMEKLKGRHTRNTDEELKGI